MKRFALLLLIAVLFLISCNSKNSSKQVLLTAQNLKSVFITLNADSAYNLKTPKGAVIKISRNSFDVKPNEKINLEIKEAYSAADILLAGLTTKSNGRLLQSGGMIYINATANDKEVKMVKPINIGIPSVVYDERMQLFKGEVENDGSINWVDPKPLDTAPAAKKIINGEALFKASCASCHKVEKDFTGPVLAGWRNRVPGGDWIYQFIANPSAMQQTDPYARALLRKWNYTQMTAFNLSKSEVDAIMVYVDNEAMLNPGLPGNTSMADSTGKQPINTPCLDTQYYPLPDTSIQMLPIDTLPDSTGISYPGTKIPEVPMYQFDIDRSGWYNIDYYINNNQNLVTDVMLTATLKMPKELNVEVYLCIPTRKLLTNGNKMQNGTYQFYGDETIPLILNDEAIIFAFASDTATAYYGITRFSIKDKQNIAVNLKASTKEEILNAIKSNKLDGVKIEIEKPVIYTTEINVTDTTTTDNLKQEMQIIETPCDNKIDSVKPISQFKK